MIPERMFLRPEWWRQKLTLLGFEALNPQDCPESWPAYGYGDYTFFVTYTEITDLLIFYVVADKGAHYKSTHLASSGAAARQSAIMLDLLKAIVNPSEALMLIHHPAANIVAHVLKNVEVKD